MGPIVTNNSDAKVALLNAQNRRWRLGPIDKRHSGSNQAVLHSQINTRSLGRIETFNSDPNVAVLHAKTTNEGRDTYRLVILMLIKLFCMHTTTGEVWNPRRLVFLLLITLFCMHKTTRWGLGSIETTNSGHNKRCCEYTKPQVRAGTHGD